METEQLDKQPEAQVALQQIVSQYGFEKCEWGPNKEDKCEGCGLPEKQLYFSGTSNDGVYHCLDCILRFHNENIETMAEIIRLQDGGHTDHCAARQVWGDGECECELKGIIPGPISRLMCEG